jgi:hypothetical protein
MSACLFAYFLSILSFSNQQCHFSKVCQTSGRSPILHSGFNMWPKSACHFSHWGTSATCGLYEAKSWLLHPGPVPGGQRFPGSSPAHCYFLVFKDLSCFEPLAASSIFSFLYLIYYCWVLGAEGTQESMNLLCQLDPNQGHVICTANGLNDSCA